MIPLFWFCAGGCAGILFCIRVQYDSESNKWLDQALDMLDEATDTIEDLENRLKAYKGKEAK